MSSVSKGEVKEALYDTAGDEYEYRGDVASINACLTGPDSVEVGHFLVQRDCRREGIGSVLFEALLEVLREEDVSYIRVRVQALGDGSCDDPIMEFFGEYGLEYRESVESHNWGTCVVAEGSVW